jgi:diguanylate cyclase (GGDEF)-like protein/PAS domain S-box-containing protein
MEAFYFSPMLLGVNLIFALAIAATALWTMSRPMPAPVFWMIGAWSLVLGVALFGLFVVTRNPVLNVVSNMLQLCGEAIFVLGIFRFIGRPVPYWILPASVAIVGGMNVHYWVTSGNSDLLMTVYAIVAGLLPLQAVFLLLRLRDDPSTRPARVLVGVCLALYSVVTFMRAGFAWDSYATGQPYTQPYESFSYLLPYNFGIPFLVMGFIGMTLMTMQRILAGSRANAERAKENTLRFERLLNVSSAGVAVLRDGRICDSNRQLETLFGRSRQQLLESEFALYFKKRERDLLASSLSAADGTLIDIDVRRNDGGILNTELRVLPLLGDSGDYVAEIRDVSHRRTLEDELKRLATTDPLTGVLNRRSFEGLFSRALQRSIRHKVPMCLAMLDLDHFKRVNDLHGHQAGDEALRQFSQYCEREARGTDVFARIGGEEFVLLLTDTPVAGALTILQRLFRGVATLRLEGSNGYFSIELSAGLAEYVEGDTLESLLQRADRALYNAKEEGRNRISTSS